MLQNDFCRRLNIEHPILLGPMAIAGSPELVAAVSATGGFGILPTGMYDRAGLAAAIAKIKGLTDKPFGLNLVARNPGSRELVDVAAAEGIKWVTTSAGSPDVLTPALKQAGVGVLHVVPSVRAAKKAAAAGVDGVIAEGGESGGFLARDDVSTLVLVPQVADAVNIPVIAAGGIGDGRGLAAALMLGAQAVQMGTRFLAASESGVHRNYRDALVAAAETDTVRFGPPGGAMRVLRNKIIDAAQQIPDPEGKAEFMAQLYNKMGAAMLQGDVEEGLVVAGSIAGMIKSVKPTTEIIAEIVSEAKKALSLGETFAP